jgi:hypothetical protein
VHRNARIGIPKAFFAPPSRPHASAGGHPSPAAPAASPARSGGSRSGAQQGLARQCAVWTCGLGWGRVESHRFLGARASGQAWKAERRGGQGKGWPHHRISPKQGVQGREATVSVFQHQPHNGIDLRMIFAGKRKGGEGNGPM